jgi:AraC-like DNA-binding protein
MPARLCPVSTGQSVGFFNVQPWSRIPREVHVSKRDHLAGSDHAALWRVPGLGDVEMFRASLSRLIFAAHSHEEYFIAVTEKGRADLRFRDDRHPISSGDVIILNPEEVHAGGPMEASVWEYRSLYPPAWLMQEVAEQVGRCPVASLGFSKNTVRDPLAAALLREAHVSAEQRGTLLEQQSRLLRALARLVAHHSSPSISIRPDGAETAAVDKAREYLDAHATHEVSLPDLANVVGLSPFHLCRVFRRRVGVPPHAYQIQMRVRTARRLLAGGTSLSDAAVAAGFFDQAHMTRHFKRMVGITPGQYQRTWRVAPTAG